MSPHSAGLITMLCTIRSAHHGEMNHCFACSFRFTHALTLCRYPLMREKCFGDVVGGRPISTRFGLLIFGNSSSGLAALRATYSRP